MVVREMSGAASSGLGRRPANRPRPRLATRVVVLLVAFGLCVAGYRFVRTGFTGLGSPDLPAAMVGSSWAVTAIADGPRPVLMPAGAKPPTLTLRRHSFSVTGDCNDETGTLHTSGSKITFSVNAGSLVACGNAAAYVDLQRLVRGAAHFTLKGDTLVLRTGAHTFILRRRPAAA